MMRPDWDDGEFEAKAGGCLGITILIIMAIGAVIGYLLAKVI